MPPLRIARYLLFFSLALGLISVAREVSPLYSLLTLASLLVGLIMEEKDLPHLPALPVTLGAFVLILVTLSGMHLQVFFSRIMGILFILISAKLLTGKNVRDYLQLFLLSLLLMAGAAVVRWGMEFGLLLTANIFLLITGLVFLFASTERETLSSREVQTLFLWGSIMSLVLLPATALFFLILPRPSIALTPGWAGGKRASSGFGEKISPGRVENIKRDTSVAMRVEWLQGPRPPRESLYWRGKIYGDYRQGVWKTPPMKRRRISLPPLPQGERVTYRIFLEPQESSALFTLGIPLAVNLAGKRTLLGPGFTLHAPSPITRRTSYTAVSRLVKAYPPLLPPEEFLQVPPPVALRLHTLAYSISPGERDPIALAQAVERYLKANYGYSLHSRNPGPYPVVSFLLKKGKGHCEYFATSMVLIMRLRGVPARMVAGFQGGEWNRLGHYYIVRNSQAHTWVEVYKEGVGWVPFDPTPPLPPDAMGAAQRLGSLGRIMDYLRFQWYHWVISYDVERQTRLLKRAVSLLSPSTPRHIPSPSRLPKRSILVVISMMAALFLAYRFLIRWLRRPQTWGEKLVNVLQEAGFPLFPGETLLELAHRLGLEDPELGDRIKRSVELYYWKEYGGGAVSSQALGAMLKEIKTLAKRAKKRARGATPYC